MPPQFYHQYYYIITRKFSLKTFPSENSSSNSPSFSSLVTFTFHSLNNKRRDCIISRRSTRENVNSSLELFSLSLFLLCHRHCFHYCLKERLVWFHLNILYINNARCKGNGGMTKNRQKNKEKKV